MVKESKGQTNSSKGERATVHLGGRENGIATVGRNKSGKPWKKQSQQSAFRTKKSLPKSYIKRMEEAKKRKALQERVAELRAADREKVSDFDLMSRICDYRKWDKCVVRRKEKSARSSLSGNQPRSKL